MGTRVQDVIEADGCDVVWHRAPGSAQRRDGADAGQVIARDERAERRTELKDAPHGCFAARGRVLAVRDQSIIDLQAGLPEGVVERPEPLGAVPDPMLLAGDEADPPVAMLDQMADRLADAPDIVDQDSRTGCLGCGADDGQAGTEQVLDIASLGLRQVIGDHHEPIGVPWPDWHQVRVRCRHGPGCAPVGVIRHCAGAGTQEDVAVAVTGCREHALQQDVRMTVDGPLIHRPRRDEADDGPPSPGIHQDLPAPGQD